jgi:hypothetical protein
MSFCGLVFAGGGVILFVFFPHLFLGIVGIKTFALFCGLLGGGLQNLVSGFFNRFSPPVTRFISYYEKIMELHLLGRSSIISPTKYDEMVDKLTDERFLGGIQQSNSER